MKPTGINLQQLEADLTRQAIFEGSIAIIVLIALFWATYWVIKAGVRDGIKESRPWHTGAQSTMPPTPPGYKWKMVREQAHTVDMRAD